MASYSDPAEKLPIEVWEIICSFLDLKTLIICAKVNAAWNYKIITLRTKIWQKACLKDGIYINKRCQNSLEFKNLAEIVKGRDRDLGDPSVRPFEFGDVIYCMCCNGERLFVGFQDRVEFWNLDSNEGIILMEGLASPPLYLKIDENVIAAGLTSASINFWSIKEEKRWSLQEEVKGSTLYSFEYLDNFVVVCCSNKNAYETCIYLYSSTLEENIKLSSFKERGKAMNIRLVPVDGTKLLDFFYLIVRSDQYGTDLMRCSVETISRNVKREFIRKFPVVNSLCRRLYVSDTGALLYDGGTIFILDPHPETCALTYWIYKSRSYGLFDPYEMIPITVHGQILSLLGVGERYLAYVIRQEDSQEVLILANKITHKEETRLLAPRRICLGTNDFPCRRSLLTTEDYFCLPDKTSLDGRNREEKDKIEYACITEDRLGVYIRKSTTFN